MPQRDPGVTSSLSTYNAPGNQGDGRRPGDGGAHEGQSIRPPTEHSASERIRRWKASDPRGILRRQTEPLEGHQTRNSVWRIRGHEIGSVEGRIDRKRKARCSA